MAISLAPGFLAGLAFCLSLTVPACSDRSNAARIPKAESTARPTAPVTPDAAVQQQALVMTMGGPKIEVDSSASEPRLEQGNNDYVLRLPARTAKLLFDSLPGFSPLSLASYPRAATPPFTYLHADVELPSVLIGDFNGDSKLDVALEGRANQTSAAVILLSQSGTPNPKLVLLTKGDTAPADSAAYLGLLHPQDIKDRYTLEVAVSLRSDAVQRVVPYQSSIVYYLENDTLRHYAYPGD